MSMSYTELAARRLGAAYSGVSEDEAASLPLEGVLGPILEALLDLLMGCFGGGQTGAAERALEQAREGSLRTRFMLRLRARRAGLDQRRFVDAVLSAAEVTTAEELNGFVVENLRAEGTANGWR